jgi:hypothetical protein
MARLAIIAVIVLLSFGAGVAVSPVLPARAGSSTNHPCPPDWLCYSYVKVGMGAKRVPDGTPGSFRACSEIPKPGIHGEGG